MPHPTGKSPAPRPAPKPATRRVVAESRPRGPGLGALLVRLGLVAIVGGAGFLFWQEVQQRRELAARPPAPPASPRPTAVTDDFKDMTPAPVTPAPGGQDPAPIAPATTPEAVTPAIPPAGDATETRAPKTYGLKDLKEGEAVLALFAKEKNRFTQPVETAYVNYMKAKTRAELADRKSELPADFLAWAENDQERALAIYGARGNPTEFLLWLRALEIDVGRDEVRSRHTPLAFALATVCVAQGMKADIRPRAPMKLVIPGDPRVPVNTKDPKRTLDVNDHIINFLEDHEPIAGDIVGGMAQALPELVYDSRGVATSLKKKKGASPKVKRKLIAADVFASAELQKEFNAYMKSKGCDVSIDCGNRVVFPGQTEAVEGPLRGRINDAFMLFRTAYEEKGRLAKCDPAATPAERFAYIIRNDSKAAFPDAYEKGKHKLIEFPLNAPWPMLTFLAADDQPLREREDTVTRLKKNGEFHTYGEYIGDIAQQGDMQRARRLAPYEFGYRTGPSHVGRDPMAMMIKDGGVCGTMAAMCVCSYNTVNVPATTAGQPGHCALIYAARDPRSRKYRFEGGHYVTAGHEGTHPHTPWYFGDLNKNVPMVWHLATAHAVNFGEKAFMQSLTAQRFLVAAPDELRAAHTASVLTDAVKTNPYNLSAAADLIAATDSAKDILELRKLFKSAILASLAKADLEANGGLHLKTLEDMTADRLKELPAATDPNTGKFVTEILRKRASDLAAEAAKKAAEDAKKAAEEDAKKGGKSAKK